MPRNQNLRNTVINQFLDSISQGNLSSPIPSNSALSNMFDVSRTTVKNVLLYLCQIGVLSEKGTEYFLKREPKEEDFFKDITHNKSNDNEHFGQVFTQLIYDRIIKAGDTFSEIELARRVGVQPIEVREFLLTFSKYNLIENINRGQWMMKVFDEKYAQQVFELRELLETYALHKFINLPDNDIRWSQARELLISHRSLRDTVGSDYKLFFELDRQFHQLIFSAADNPFVDQFWDIFTIIFHSHYQWGKSDNLKERNILAIEEHMAVLTCLINKNDIGATHELYRHLNTAKKNMVEGLHN